MERNLRGEMILVAILVVVIAFVGFQRLFPHSQPAASQPASDGFTPRSVHSTDRNAFGVPVTWSTSDIGSGYQMNIGRYQKYVVAMEIVKNNEVILRDYTPPGEYVVFVDPKYRNYMESPVFCRAKDRSTQIAFRQSSITDPRLHSYFSYRLSNDTLELAEYEP